MGSDAGASDDGDGMAHDGVEDTAVKDLPEVGFVKVRQAAPWKGLVCGEERCLFEKTFYFH